MEASRQPVHQSALDFQFLSLQRFVGPMMFRRTVGVGTNGAPERPDPANLRATRCFAMICSGVNR